MGVGINVRILAPGRSDRAHVPAQIDSELRHSIEGQFGLERDMKFAGLTTLTHEYLDGSSLATPCIIHTLGSEIPFGTETCTESELKALISAYTREAYKSASSQWPAEIIRIFGIQQLNAEFNRTIMALNGYERPRSGRIVYRGTYFVLDIGADDKDCWIPHTQSLLPSNFKGTPPAIFFDVNILNEYVMRIFRGRRSDGIPGKLDTVNLTLAFPDICQFPVLTTESALSWEGRIQAILDQQ